MSRSANRYSMSRRLRVKRLPGCQRNRNFLGDVTMAGGTLTSAAATMSLAPFERAGGYVDVSFIAGRALLAAVSACSPYNYSKEISAFSNSVDGLSTSVTSGHDALVEDDDANRRRDLIFNQRNVAFPPSCADRAGTATKDEPPCAVQRVGDTAPPADPDPIPPELSTVLMALKNYAKALALVTAASAFA